MDGREVRRVRRRIRERQGAAHERLTEASLARLDEDEPEAVNRLEDSISERMLESVWGLPSSSDRSGSSLTLLRESRREVLGRSAKRRRRRERQEAGAAMARMIESAPDWGRLDERP